ncbi:hypothetical protein G8759_14815 [Spirosoma aureum]|uniref:Uncharacterized protein n=1 Tax=Spirosoma aureum TaxID=2692134 RepID=A0A6G9AMS2_9BACT|nr:hypothetical protein [Spirosoma aureum]QIP13792.1 hypothetical protein G8759_14815 [Spirosoma aureum]
METTITPSKPTNKIISQIVLKYILNLCVSTLLIPVLKKPSIFFLILIASIHFSSNSFAQPARSVSPLESFIQNKGVKILAQCAHPFNTYTEGQYSIDGNNIRVWVSYSNGTTETLQLHYNPDDDYFDGVRCTAGDECSYSFMAMKMVISSMPKGQRSCLERFFHTTFDNMSGEQIAAAGLTDELWKWRGKSCN